MDAVCYQCNVCHGPMGPLDLVIPVEVPATTESSVRHADGAVCGWISEFIAERDQQFLQDARIVPYRID